MELPKRKRNRLIDFDYSSPIAYFITACTEQRRNLFWNNVGATIGRLQDVQLSPCGEIVKKAIEEIPQHYPAVVIEHYVVMPNHVHLLLRIGTDNFGRPLVASWV